MNYIIDRFEGEFAVIEVDGAFFNLPRQLVPQDAAEGDVLSMEIDQAATAERKKRISHLMDSLFED